MIIPKEDAPSFQRWQIGSFDAKPRPAVEPVKTQTPTAPPVVEQPPVSLPTAEEIERIYEEARSEGYATGLAEGRAAGEQQLQEAQATAVRQIEALIVNLKQALDSVDQSVAEQLLDLGIEIAAQVTCGTITTKQDVLLPIIREAIATLPLHHSHITLRLNPVDAARIRPLLGEEFAQTGTQIVENGEITPGGLLLQAGTSEVDARLEMRWKRVLEAMGTEPREWLNP